MSEIKPAHITRVAYGLIKFRYNQDGSYRIILMEDEDVIDTEELKNYDVKLSYGHFAYEITVDGSTEKRTIHGCQCEWNAKVNLMRDSGMSMIPTFVASYEELRIRDAVSLHQTMIPSWKDRIRDINADNKITVFWKRIKGSGSTNFCSYHGDNQVKIATPGHLRFYSIHYRPRA